jgi:hypothetical protein
MHTRNPSRVIFLRVPEPVHFVTHVTKINFEIRPTDPLHQSYRALDTPFRKPIASVCITHDADAFQRTFCMLDSLNFSEPVPQPISAPKPKTKPTPRLKIRICPETREQINRLIIEVNGDAWTHTVTRAEVFERDAERLEKWLGRRLTKKFFLGAAYHCTSGEAVAKAYQYSRIATAYTLTRGSKYWYLTQLERTRIFQSGGSEQIVLTDKQDAEAVRVLRTGYEVRTKPACTA